LICFISGEGGTGKSTVIKAYVSYCQKVCKNLAPSFKFDLKTIVVTAITGAAAVSINGQTTTTGFKLKYKTVTDDDTSDYKYTFCGLADEVSFAKRQEIEKLNFKLGLLKEKVTSKFGTCDIIFGGDFSQLRPVRSTPIYLEKDFVIWDEWVHTYFELKKNHRFKNDPSWGELLTRFRDTGPTHEDGKKINARIIGSVYGPKEEDIPKNVTYACKSNLDRMAVNEGIFARHIESTHSCDPSVDPPKHTICIMAGDLKWKKGKNDFVNMNQNTKDIFYSCVGEAQVRSHNNSKMYDPLLKLYKGRPVMINDNIDVENCIANGTMCEFEGVVFKEGVTFEDLRKVVIDGYYVWCAHVSQIKCLKLRLLDGLKHKDEIRYTYLEPQKIAGKAHFPIPIYAEINKATFRMWRSMQMTCFPLNTANARTIHKLQGRTIEAMIINSWDYTGNWIYVALSRVTTLKGLYLRLPLDIDRCRGMSHEVRLFMEKCRAKGAPPRVHLHNYNY
jgi:hypothetical protein